MRSNMRMMRESAGLSQQDVADLVGVHVNTVSAWERGTAEPLGSNLIALSELYDCRPELLLATSQKANSLVVA